MIEHRRVEVVADLPEGELRFSFHESFSDEEATILMANYLAWEFMRVEPLRHIKVYRQAGSKSGKSSDI